MNLAWKSRAPRTQTKRQDVHCPGESQNQRAKREAENKQNQPTVGKSEECGPRAWGAGGMTEQEGLRTCREGGEGWKHLHLDARGLHSVNNDQIHAVVHKPPACLATHNTSKQDGSAFPGQRSTPSVLGAPASGTGTGPGG